MGFYGNITNVNKTQFAFDRTYPNRYTMDNRILLDSIYLGRYVLVEYDNQATQDTFVRAYRKDVPNEQGRLNLYAASGFEEVNLFKWTNERSSENPLHGKGGNVLTGQIVYIEEGSSYVYYKCVTESGAPGVTVAEFERAVEDNGSPYTVNFNIDAAVYGQGRGYDSTVWQKVYVDGSEKFVMIAELNSVVPTFALAEDAPTMSPLTPHFDSDSTNVYYKLHWQPQWGLRVSEQEALPSDSTTVWLKDTYDPATDIKTHWYWHIGKNDWVSYEDLNKVFGTANAKLPAAIHFNKAAFDKQLDEKRLVRETEESVIKKYHKSDNYLTILPTGESGKDYYVHDGTGRLDKATDIQEMRVNLPAIGNMMSDAWDAIHGPLRNNDMREVDANGDPVDSLVGRLKSIAAIKRNEIPVKRVADGRLVGTKINGDVQHTAKPEVLDEELSKSFTGDDAWIYTKIDSDKITDEHNNGIAIHHTFHATGDSTSWVNKNGENKNGDGTDTMTNGTGGAYKANDIPVSNQPDINSETDVIRLYTPYVDAAGHVVGHNQESVRLPYGYKKFTTTALNNESGKDLYTTITNVANGNNTSTSAAAASQTIASKTQDVMQINPVNKWIQTKFENDKLTIAHEVHAVNEVAQTSDINGAGDTITFQDLEFDTAGHVTKNQKHTYTLPYSYKTIKVSNTANTVVNAPATGIIAAGQVADNTQDTLTLAASNRWIKVDNATEDTVKFGHLLGQFKTGTSANKLYGLEQDEDHTGNLDADNSFEVPCLSFDEAGHITEARTHKVTLPELFNKIAVTPTSTSVADSSVYSAGTVTADNLNDTVTMASGNKWIELPVDPDNDKITVQHYVKAFNETTDAVDYTASGNKFTVQDIAWDEAGHLIASKKTAYTIPNNYQQVQVSNSQVSGVATSDAVISGEFAASTPQSTLTLDTGNRWIQLNADITGSKVTLQHAAAGTASLSVGDTTAKTPTFGATFLVPSVGIDQAGHVKDLAAHTVKIPQASLTANGTNGGAGVITALALTPTSGAFTYKKDDIGTLKLTGYVEGTDAGDVAAADSVNVAFGKLQVQIKDEEARAAGAEQTLTTNLQSEINRAKGAENTLTTNLTTEVNRAKGVENTLTTDLAAEVVRAQGKELEISEALAAEVSRASKKEAELEVTISNLQAIIEELTSRLEALENN